MNKAKLVKLADEVLTDIDFDMNTVLRTYLEHKLLDKLSNRFRSAFYYLIIHQNVVKTIKKIMNL